MNKPSLTVVPTTTPVSVSSTPACPPDAAREFTMCFTQVLDDALAVVEPGLSNERLWPVVGGDTG
jgi:hypothetical protein